MEERLAHRVIGKEEAVKAVANAVRSARSGLQDPNRAIGSCILLGPTGVGKTELARALCEFLFDVENAMTHLATRLAAQQLALELDAAGKKFIAKEGYDPQFGARPLKRAIQEHLLDPLALKLLAGEFKAGDRIKATAGASGILFKK